ncbi:MAG: hypothetical protein J1E02_03695 [Coprobacter sp.]|nr:hypothetical protein [Coprobacter sp.]
MKEESIFCFYRQQRRAILFLLVLTGGILAFRYGRQHSASDPEPELLYEQFQSEIDAFEAQLKEKEAAPKAKTKKTPQKTAPKRRKSPSEVRPKVQSMQAIQETVETDVSKPVGESRRIVPMEEE